MAIIVPTSDCVAGHHLAEAATQTRDLHLWSGEDVTLPMCDVHALRFDKALALEGKLVHLPRRRWPV